MIPITARFQSKLLIMIFGSLGCSALIFQTVFSGNPEYAWTSHVAAPIIGGSFSGMMGLGISYGNEFTNMSGKYAMLTFIGMQFTGALIVKLAGFLMATLSYQWYVFIGKLPEFVKIFDKIPLKMVKMVVLEKQTRL